MKVARFHALLNAVTNEFSSAEFSFILFIALQTNVLDVDSSRALCIWSTVGDGKALLLVMGLVPKHFFQPNSELNDIVAANSPINASANIVPT